MAGEASAARSSRHAWAKTGSSSRPSSTATTERRSGSSAGRATKAASVSVVTSSMEAVSTSSTRGK